LNEGAASDKVIHRITLTSNTGNTAQNGNDKADVLTQSLTFEESNMPVGFKGWEGNLFVQKLGAVTVPKTCVKGAEIPASTSSGSSDETKSDNTTIIIAIVVPVAVVLLVLMAVGGWCLYKINVYNKDKKGLEVVAVTKTRPSTPPKDEVKAMNEPAVGHHTDEEENPNGDEKKAEYQKMKSTSEKPDINI
jgi:flagellar basal body-associated protein FliL